MAQLIERGPSVAGSLGAALGQGLQGLGTGLQSLADMKLQQMMQQQQQGKLAQSLAAFGVSPDVAQSLALLPPELQKAALQNLPALQQFGKAPQGGEPGQEGQVPSGISAGELFKSPQQRAMEERNIIARQKLFAPQIKDIQDKAIVERRIVKFGEDALKNIDKALTGLKGKITPDFLQSHEGQKLITDLQNIVLLKAQQGKGLPTKQRLLLENAAKAQTWQRPSVIKEIVNDIINDPDTQKIINQDVSLNKLIEQHGGNLPANFPSLLEKETKKIGHEKKKEKEVSAAKFTKESLPDPSKYAENSRAKNPVTGEYQFVVKNGKWEEI